MGVFHPFLGMPGKETLPVLPSVPPTNERHPVLLLDSPLLLRQPQPGFLSSGGDAVDSRVPLLLSTVALQGRSAPLLSGRVGLPAGRPVTLFYQNGVGEWISNP